MIPTTEIDSNQYHHHIQYVNGNALLSSLSQPITFQYNTESKTNKPQLAYEMYLKLMAIAEARKQQINSKDVLLAAYTGRHLMYNNNYDNNFNCNKVMKINCNIDDTFSNRS